MSEKLQILFMQTRMVRAASEEWNMSLEEVNDLFSQFNVYRYISDFWDIFHVEGDKAVLEDIRNYLKSKEAYV
ncbi:MAG: DUF3791 domain-containing protein [Lachnospiraceae bacterium]|nr:DUF3791 domain-containing protein [Lachnospiraceae bacterium]